MITGYIINFFYILLYNVINIIPAGGTLSTDMTDSFTLIVSYMKNFSFLFAFNTFFEVLYLVVAFEVSILTFKICLWLIRTVRGSA